MLALAAVFLGLGAWQVQRLFWKLDLIARVEARVSASPVPAPSAAAWPAVNARNNEYRRVTASGIFRHDRETLVQAVTALGAGFWVLTPLEEADGSTIVVNRGFVPSDRRDRASRQTGEVQGQTQVAGLLRLTEPEGAFLRANDPPSDRWYSRDIAAIGAARGLVNVAPFFIDADATQNPGGYPIGGLTVVQFRNSHLVYACTWFAMAAMTMVAMVFVIRKRLV